MLPAPRPLRAHERSVRVSVRLPVLSSSRARSASPCLYWPRVRRTGSFEFLPCIRGEVPAHFITILPPMYSTTAAWSARAPWKWRAAQKATCSFVLGYIAHILNTSRDLGRTKSPGTFLWKAAVSNSRVPTSRSLMFIKHSPRELRQCLQHPCLTVPSSLQ